MIDDYLCLERNEVIEAAIIHLQSLMDLTF